MWWIIMGNNTNINTEHQSINQYWLYILTSAFQKEIMPINSVNSEW